MSSSKMFCVAGIIAIGAVGCFSAPGAAGDGESEGDDGSNDVGAAQQAVVGQEEIFLGDLSNDGRDDIVGRDLTTGVLRIGYADVSGHFHAWSWAAGQVFCNDPSGRVVSGDFNGDGRMDLLCHHTATGDIDISYATLTSKLNGVEYHGAIGCEGPENSLVVGDFNGDGRNDLVCHHQSGGNRRQFADAAGHFNASSSSWAPTLGKYWCGGIVGVEVQMLSSDFNGDGRSDMLCHNRLTGTNYISYASFAGQLPSSGWQGASECAADYTVVLGDFNGDARTDLVCHHISGYNALILADAAGHLDATTAANTLGEYWCGGDVVLMAASDMSGEGRDDMLCRNTENGTVYVSYADAAGQLPASGWQLFMP